MTNAVRAARSRKQMDKRLRSIRPAKHFATPVRGWLKAIRESIGMSSAQLGKRLGVTQPSVIALEHSEIKGTIEMRSLRRAAEALNCTLVYALVPKQSLEVMVRDRARALALSRRIPIEHSMLLENQAVRRKKDLEAELDDFIREINPRRLWDKM